MRDRVLIPGIPLQARVGCTEDERREPQRILVDVELRCDVRPASRSDSVGDAIDYVSVRNDAEGIAGQRPYALIESLAEAIATALLAKYPTGQVVVRVRKPSALARFGVPWAGVEVVRERDG